MINVNDKDLGLVTAYAYAVSKGYTGTEEEFATLMASYATVAEEAAESAEQAAQSATNAAASESSASTSASQASSSASAASSSATSAETSASAASGKASEAASSASTASTKASEASASAATASTKAGEASTSATNAAASATAAGNAQTAAETAQGKAEDAQTAAEAAQAAAEEAAQTLVLDTTLTQPNQAAEAKAVGDALVNKAPVIIASASGSIASFPDGANNLPVENLVVNIEPKQAGSGDPSPDNVRPITGWDGCKVVRCGKNLINYTIPNSHDLNISYSNGVYTASDGDTASSLRLKLQQRDARYGNIPDTQILLPVIMSPTTIYITTIIREGAYTLRFSNNGASQEFSKCFDISNLTPGMEVTFSVNLIDITVGAVKFKDCQLEFGSTASNYTPFQDSSTYPISWASTSGTVYGGRVNLVTGELVVDRAMVDLGTLTWTKNDVTEGTLFRAMVSDMVAGENRAWFICSAFPHVPIAQRANKTISQRLQNNVDIIDNDYSDAATFKTSMSGVQLCYELATPLTYQLTPTQVVTLLGVNNIWADCGDTEVEYRADTKLYIERLTQPTEDDMVANANIASGKYFLVGNALYLSTTAIAAGEAIVPGTNCTATNLAEALNTLNA